MEVEDDVELAHVAVVLVHLLDVAMDNLERDQLIVGGVAAGDEEERGVAAIDDLGIWRRACERGEDGIVSNSLTLVLEKVAHAGAAGEHQLRDVLDDLGLVLGREGGEPFGQTLRGLSRGLLHSGVGDQPLCPGARAE